MSMARIVLFIGLLAFSAANETIDSLKKLEIKLDSVTEALTQKISVLEKENLELKEKVEHLEWPVSVYFAGIQNFGNVEAGEDITFERALINVGDAFDASTGHFVAPVAGNYEFSVSGRGYQSTRIEVYVNEVWTLKFYREKGEGVNEDEGDVSHIFNLNLAKGDDVHLRLERGMLECGFTYPATFIGKLILVSGKK